MDLVTYNQALLDEYRRITGDSNHFAFAAWCAEQVRQTASACTTNWDLLSRTQQREQIFARLHAMPPATWPRLELVVGAAR